MWGIDSHQYDQAVMMRFALRSLLALQLIHSVFSDNAGLPLDSSCPLSLLSTIPVQNANLENPTQFSGEFPGTPGFPVYDFFMSSLNLPYSSLNGPDTVKRISFSIFVQESAPDTDILSILDSDGQGLLNVSISSGELQITSTSISSDPPIIEDFNKPLQTNQWNEVTIFQGPAFPSPMAPVNYYSGVNGVVVSRGIQVVPWDLTDADLIFSGGASIACFFVSDDELPTDYNSIIGNSPCKDYDPFCPDDVNEANFTAIPPLCCDEANTASCQNVTFTGTGLDAAGGYNCSVQYFKLNSSGALVEDGSLDTFAAVSVTETEAVCILNGDATAVVTLSRSGTDHVSATVKVLPTQCIGCTDTLVCNPTGNGCLIDGNCLSPGVFVPGSFSQICDPQADPLGPTPVPLVDVSLNNCGVANGTHLNETDDGYTTAAGALSAVSSAITLSYTARIPFCTRRRPIVERDLFKLGPGIKVSQEGGKVVVNLKFTDPVTGNVEEREAVINASNGKCEGRRSPIRKCFWKRWNTWYKKRCNNRCKCAVAFTLHHDPQTGNTTLTVNTLKRRRWAPKIYAFDGTLGLSLLTTEELFINKEVPSCVTFTNDASVELGSDEAQTDYCFEFVCQDRPFGRKGWKWNVCKDVNWAEPISRIPRGKGKWRCNGLGRFFGI